jgi:sensor c-di-GMP phosphodiesterase-like protein
MDTTLIDLFKKSMIFLLIVSIAGCVTTSVEYVKEKDFPPDKVYKITILYLKDGKIIDVSGKDAKFKLSHNGTQNVVVIESDTKTDIIKVTEIDRVKIEVRENNVLLTTAIIIGSLVLLLFLLMLISPPFEGSIV